MTVAALPSTVSYLEDGASTVFPVPFRFKASSDLVVERVSGGVALRLMLGSDYAVQGGDTDAGGTVTRLTASVGAVLRIRRQTARAQPMVYNPNDRFPAKSHEGALDQQMLIAQEQDATVADLSARAVTLPEGEIAPVLPVAAIRAGGVLTFDPASGAPVVKPEAMLAPGAAGPSNNTRLTLAALRAAAITDSTSLYAGSLWTWTLGDFSSRVDDVNVVRSDSTAPSVGAWVRQSASNISFSRLGAQALIDLQTKAALTVNIEDFGAYPSLVYDSTDDIERALNVLPNGTQINFQPGGRYVVRRTLLFKKAFVFNGGGREQCEIHFAADGDYLTAGAGGPKAAVIFLHPSVVGINGYDGQPATTAASYAGRTVLRGMRFSGDAMMPANTVGLFVAAPVYGYESEFLYFTGDGVQISSGNDRPTKGNANGTTFTNCNSQLNKQSGWSLLGNDVNRCVLTACNSAGNGLHGYYEDVIIGNTYASCEADSNSGTSYVSVRATSRSVYLHCYSETFPHFDVGPRCLLLNMQGNISPDRSYGGGYFGVLPSRDMFSYTGIVTAESEVVANVLGGPTGPGKAFRISEDGIDWRMFAGQGLTQLTSAGSPNYLRLSVAGAQSSLWCAMDVAGNLKKGVQWAVGGLAFGVKSAILGSGSAPPSTGSYEQGAIFFNDTPTAGGKIGWVCVAAGSPGTWKAFGSIDA